MRVSITNLITKYTIETLMIITFSPPTVLYIIWHNRRTTIVIWCQILNKILIADLKGFLYVFGEYLRGNFFIIMLTVNAQVFY